MPLKATASPSSSFSSPGLITLTSILALVFRMYHEVDAADILNVWSESLVGFGRFFQYCTIKLGKYFCKCEILDFLTESGFLSVDLDLRSEGY